MWGRRRYGCNVTCGLQTPLTRARPSEAPRGPIIPPACFQPYKTLSRISFIPLLPHTALPPPPPNHPAITVMVELALILSSGAV